MHICNQAVTSCRQKESDSCRQRRSNRDISFHNVGRLLGCVEIFAVSNLDTALVLLGYWSPGKDSWNCTRITRYVVTAPTIWNRQRISSYKNAHPKIHSSHLTLIHPNVTSWFKYDRDYLCVNLATSVPVIFEPLCITPVLFLLLFVPLLTKLHATDIILSTILRALQLDNYPSCCTKLVGLLPSSLQTSWAS